MRSSRRAPIRHWRPTTAATLLMFGAGGKLATVEYTYEIDPRVDVVIKSGQTPMHAAVGAVVPRTQAEVCEVIQFLADKGAALDELDAAGRTALSIADGPPIDKAVELLTALIVKSGKAPKNPLEALIMRIISAVVLSVVILIRPPARRRSWRNNLLARSPTGSTPTCRPLAVPRRTRRPAPVVIAAISAAPTAPRSRMSGSIACLPARRCRRSTSGWHDDAAAAPASLADGIYLDILAHLLRENGFPAGSTELSSDAVGGVQLLPTRPRPLPPLGDFSYVEVVRVSRATKRR